MRVEMVAGVRVRISQFTIEIHDFMRSLDIDPGPRIAKEIRQKPNANLTFSFLLVALLRIKWTMRSSKG